MLLNAWKSVVGRCAVLALGIVVAVFLSSVTAHACSVCGGSAMGTDPGAGFKWSILFLILMPYAIVGAIGGWLIYTYRRALGHRRKKASGQGLAWIQKEGEY